jgi:hypothetical protein
VASSIGDIMKIRQVLQDYLPWTIVAICILQLVLALLLQHTNEAFAWIIATVGWLAYKIET